MANFATHIGAGTLVAGTLATVTLAADVVAPENVVAVTLAGVLGSILPDIDHKESRISRNFFSGLAFFFSFVALFVAAGKFSIAEMLLLWLGTLLFVRYPVKAMFDGMSYHRGIWHSWLAAVFCSLVTAFFFYYILQRHDGVAWLAAGFMFAGYMTHLVLDEIYSVDIAGRRLKASFGSAFKPIDRRRLGHSFLMAAATAVTILVTPPTRTFVDQMSSKDMWGQLKSGALPENRTVWFGIDMKDLGSHLPTMARRHSEEKTQDSNPIATGTLPSPGTSGEQKAD